MNESSFRRTTTSAGANWNGSGRISRQREGERRLRRGAKGRAQKDREKYLSLSLSLPERPPGAPEFAIVGNTSSIPRWCVERLKITANFSSIMAKNRSVKQHK